MKTLVVDRSATTRRIVLRALRAVGITAASEFSLARDAVPAAEDRPELAIVEWDAADDEALELIATLVAADGEKCRVVVLSERDQREDIERAVAYGIVGYVLKPFEARVLIEQLATAIQTAVSAADPGIAEAA